MNAIERTVRRIDAFQQRHLVPGFVFAITKKFGDDNGGALTVQLTYAMFTTIFPLLLLLETILAIVLAGHAHWAKAVENSTFGEFPLVGSDLARNIHAMRRNSAFGLAVGILGIVYGSTGLAGTGLYVMEQTWNIPGAVRPNYIKRMGRSLTFLCVLGLGLIVTTFLSSFGTFGKHNFWYGVASEAVAALANVGLYLAAFRVLTPRQIETRRLLPGVVFAGIVWTVLQALGGYVVGHYLKDDNTVYGTFGTVLGLIAWIYIGAEVTAYAAELNVVLARRLWPRAMVQPPLTAADQHSIALQAIQNQRRPEQEVISRVRGRPMTQDEYRAAGHKVDTSVIGRVDRVPDDAAAPPSSDGGPDGGPDG
jgi:YihY family inner membrane protein